VAALRPADQKLSQSQGQNRRGGHVVTATGRRLEGLSAGPACQVRRPRPVVRNHSPERAASGAEYGRARRAARPLEGVELNFDKSRFDCIYMYVRRGGFRTLLSIILWENNYVF
jgi:hypothetical protein